MQDAMLRRSTWWVARSCCVAWMIAMLALSACKPRRTDRERLAPPSAAHGDDSVSHGMAKGFSHAMQEAGSPTDGLTLHAIRWGAHPGHVRMVFELDGDQIPATRVQPDPERPVIEVSLGGVRKDVTGNRPLRDESGARLGKPVHVGEDPVIAYGRRQVLDDSLVAYEVRLTRRRAFRLRALRDPTRIILDVSRAPAGAR